MSTETRLDPAWLDAHWMPFTGNRQFKAHPRMLVAAQGAYYTDVEGKQVFDGLSGLWCMVLAVIGFSIMAACVKVLGPRIPSHEKILLRSIATVPVLPSAP